MEIKKTKGGIYEVTRPKLINLTESIDKNFTLIKRGIPLFRKPTIYVPNKYAPESLLYKIGKKAAIVLIATLPSLPGFACKNGDDPPYIPPPDNVATDYAELQTSDTEIINTARRVGTDDVLDDNEKIFIDTLVDTKSQFGSIPQSVKDKSLDGVIEDTELVDTLSTPGVKLKRTIVHDGSTHYDAPLISDVEMEARKDDDWDNYVPSDLQTTLEADIAALGPTPTLMEVMQKVQEDVQIWANANGEFNCLLNSYKQNASLYHFTKQLGLDATVWQGGAITGMPYNQDFNHEETFVYDNTAGKFWIVRSTINYVEEWGDTGCVYFSPNPYGATGYTDDEIATLYLEFDQAVDRDDLMSAKGATLTALDQAHDLDIIQPPTGNLGTYITITEQAARDIVNTKIASGYNLTMQDLIKKLESTRESDLTINKGLKYILGFNGIDYRIWAVDTNSYDEIFNATGSETEFNSF